MSLSPQHVSVSATRSIPSAQAACLAGVARWPRIGKPTANQLCRHGTAAAPLAPSLCPTFPPFPQVDMEFVALRTPLGRDYVPAGFLQASWASCWRAGCHYSCCQPLLAQPCNYESHPAVLAASLPAPSILDRARVELAVACCGLLRRPPRHRQRKAGWAAPMPSASASTPPCPTRWTTSCGCAGWGGSGVPAAETVPGLPGRRCRRSSATQQGWVAAAATDAALWATPHNIWVLTYSLGMHWLSLITRCPASDQAAHARLSLARPPPCLQAAHAWLSAHATSCCSPPPLLGQVNLGLGMPRDAIIPDRAFNTRESTNAFLGWQAVDEVEYDPR